MQHQAQLPEKWKWKLNFLNGKTGVNNFMNLARIRTFNYHNWNNPLNQTLKCTKVDCFTRSCSFICLFVLKYHFIEVITIPQEIMVEPDYKGYFSKFIPPALKKSQGLDTIPNRPLANPFLKHSTVAWHLPYGLSLPVFKLFIYWVRKFFLTSHFKTLTLPICSLAKEREGEQSIADFFIPFGYLRTLFVPPISSASQTKQRDNWQNIL